MMRSPGAAPTRVLVDSSIWIDFYRGAEDDGIRIAVSEALAKDAVFTAPVIVAEVVQGAPEEEALEALREDFSALRWIASGPDVGVSAARIGFALRGRGRPAPATDLLIAAAALVEDCELWHRDEHFRRIAEVVPLRQRAFS